MDQYVFSLKEGGEAFGSDLAKAIRACNRWVKEHRKENSVVGARMDSAYGVKPEVVDRLPEHCFAA